ncbi:MAG: InlB B-repeat-containing protein [Clostridia bacterium]|nr:InlB B-repeat-containing protein [Clostridia bacterium]
MKKLSYSLLVSLLLIILSLSLCACDNSDTTDEPGGDDFEGGNYDGEITYAPNVKFRMPNDESCFSAEGKVIDNTYGITLSAEGIKSDYYKKEFQYYNFDSYIYHSDYLGLFTEPYGGQMCYDANGKWTGVRTDSGIYYAQFDRGSIKIAYSGIADPASYGLPTSVKYGDRLGVDRLPVLEKEGYVFQGWKYNAFWGFWATNQYGELMANYFVVNDSNYSTILSRDKAIVFTPVFEPIYDVEIILDYNDGTFRQTSIKHCSYEWFSTSSLPKLSGTLRTLVGWSLDPNSKELIEDSTTFTEDTTLYAVWERHRYICVITELGKEEIMLVREGEPLVLENPEREGYVFVGWFDNELRTGLPISSEVKYTDPYEYYYAAWEELADEA